MFFHKLYDYLFASKYHSIIINIIISTFILSMKGIVFLNIFSIIKLKIMKTTTKDFKIIFNTKTV